MKMKFSIVIRNFISRYNSLDYQSVKGPVGAILPFKLDAVLCCSLVRGVFCNNVLVFQSDFMYLKRHKSI